MTGNEQTLDVKVKRMAAKGLMLLNDTHMCYRVQVFVNGKWRTLETKSEYKNFLGELADTSASSFHDEGNKA